MNKNETKTHSPLNKGNTKKKKKHIFSKVFLSATILISSLIPFSSTVTYADKELYEAMNVNLKDAGQLIPKEARNEKLVPAIYIGGDKDESPVEILEPKVKGLPHWIYEAMVKDGLTDSSFYVEEPESGYGYYYYHQNRKDFTGEFFDEEVVTTHGGVEEGGTGLVKNRPYVLAERGTDNGEQLIKRTRHFRPKVKSYSGRDLLNRHPEIYNMLVDKYGSENVSLGGMQEVVLYRTEHIENLFIKGDFTDRTRLDKGIYDDLLLPHEYDKEEEEITEKQAMELRAKAKEKNQPDPVREVTEKQPKPQRPDAPPETVGERPTQGPPPERVPSDSNSGASSGSKEPSEPEMVTVTKYFADVVKNRSSKIIMNPLTETKESFSNRLQRIALRSDGDFFYKKEFKTTFRGIFNPTDYPKIKEPKNKDGDLQALLKWRLIRENPDDEDVNVLTDIPMKDKELKTKIPVKHYATRDVRIEILVDGTQSYFYEDKRVDYSGSDRYIEREKFDPKRAKKTPVKITDNSELKFKVRYRYTNYYTKVCGEWGCNYYPNWSQGKIFEEEMTFQIAKDYKRFIETNDGENHLLEDELKNPILKESILPIKDLNEVAEWVVGEEYKFESIIEAIDSIEPDEEGHFTITEPRPKQFAEKVIISDEYEEEQVLVTQTGMPIVPDSMEFKIINREYDDEKGKFLESGDTSGKMPFERDEKFKTATIDSGLFGFYHPLDVDEHLKGSDMEGTRGNPLENFENDLSKFNDERVAKNDLEQSERAKTYRGKDTFLIPFAQSELKENEIKFQTEIGTMSRHTGYLNSFHTFTNIREKYKGHKNAPKIPAYFGKCDSGEDCEGIENALDKHKENFTADYDYDFIDTVLYAEDIDGNQKELTDEEIKKLQRYYIPIQIQSLLFSDGYDLGLEDEKFHLHYTHIYDIGLNKGGIGYNRPFYFDLYLLGVGGEGKDLKGGYLLTEVEDGSGETSGNSKRLTKSELNNLGKTEIKRDELEKVYGVRNFDRDYMSK